MSNLVKIVQNIGTSHEHLRSFYCCRLH